MSWNWQSSYTWQFVLAFFTSEWSQYLFVCFYILYLSSIMNNYFYNFEITFYPLSLFKWLAKLRITSHCLRLWYTEVLWWTNEVKGLTLSKIHIPKHTVSLMFSSSQVFVKMGYIPMYQPVLQGGHWISIELVVEIKNLFDVLTDVLF